MIDPQDIHSLSDFQRNTKAHLKRIKRSGKPTVLTVNGRASVIMLDVAGYRRLLEAATRKDPVVAIQGGIDDMLQGRYRDAEEALDELSVKHFSRPAPRRRKAS